MLTFYKPVIGAPIPQIVEYRPIVKRHKSRYFAYLPNEVFFGSFTSELEAIDFVKGLLLRLNWTLDRATAESKAWQTITAYGGDKC